MDLQISNIVVILDKKWEDRLDDAVKQLKQLGMQVERADDEDSVVEGTIESDRLPDLKKLECVDYVRIVFTYCAEFPPGDPRDVNGI